MNLTSNWLSTAFALSALLVAPDASAQSSYGEARAEHWSIGGGLGGFSEKNNSQLSGQDAKFTTFFGGGYRASPNVSMRGRF
ncbi:MAG: hypothetical protein ACREUQ_04295 [Burkholderiales bacterium]